MEIEASPNARLPAELRRFLLVACCATGVAWLIALAGELLRWGYPYNWPLYQNDYFYDFSVYFELFRRLHQTAFFTEPLFPFMYLPPAVVLYRGFYLFGLKFGFALYLIIVYVAIRFGLKPVRRAMLGRGLAARPVDHFLLGLVFTSYPLLFCLQRGNVEVVTASGLALGTWAYCTGRTWCAAVLWGIFGSLKLYPLLLLALFLSARQYGQLLAGCGTAVTTTLMALLYTGPTLRTAIAGTRRGLNSFLHFYILNLDSRLSSFDHSLFGLLKMSLCRYGVQPEMMLEGYFATVGAIMLALYLVRVRKLPFANQLLFLSVASVLIPPVSFDYTLLQLYAPLVVLILVLLDERPPRMTAVFVLLALLFTPTNFLFSRGESRAGQIKAALLIGLLYFAIQRPFGKSSAPEVIRLAQTNAGEVPQIRAARMLNYKDGNC